MLPLSSSLVRLRDLSTSLNAEGFSQHAMDATNNFTLMTWTPQGNALTPVATLTFAQIGTWP